MEEVKKEIILRGRLDGKQRNRLKRLLDMLYSPRELGEEVGFNPEQVYRVYILDGCPFEKDKNNRYWINGRAFAEWYKNQYKKAQLGEGDTFCKSCAKAVKIIAGETKTQKQITYIVSSCPNCGRKLTKIIDCSRGKNDK